MTPDEIMDWRKKLQNFTETLNKEPNPAEIRENQHAANSKYLPISFLEMSLDELFFGLWQVKDFKWQAMANEIVGSLTLCVFHPVANVWIERTGAAATMIRQKKGARITDLDEKIHNALEMDFPHLKADCLRNACASLGKSFGRDLNRKFADVYKPLLQQRAESMGQLTVQEIERDRFLKAQRAIEEIRSRVGLEERTEQDIDLRISQATTAEELYFVLDDIKSHAVEVEDFSQKGVANRAKAIAGPAPHGPGERSEGMRAHSVAAAKTWLSKYEPKTAADFTNCAKDLVSANLTPESKKEAATLLSDKAQLHGYQWDATAKEYR